MKKTIISLSLFFGLAMVACQNKDDGGNKNTGYAQTPNATCNLPNNQNCNPAMYQQYNQSFVPYVPEFTNYQYSYANGFCGCPAGYRPVMNTQWGLSCAPNNWFPGSQYYAGYSAQSVYQAQNTHWTAIPQVTYSPAVSGNVSNCHTQAAAACDVRNPNQCSNGGICRATSGGSTIGICTYGVGTESYSNPNQCRQQYGPWGWTWVCGNHFYNGNGGQQYNGPTGSPR